MTFKTLLKIIWNLLLWLVLCICSLHFDTVLYLSFQAKGQLHILTHTQSFEDYSLGNDTKEATEKKNKLELIRRIKAYSVDSLGYKSTQNFTRVYDQGKSPLLWVISASDKYRIKAYYWHFPIVGEVSYKGFFDERKAEAAKNHLACEGYDVDLRPVSAWSTLGWFSDPVLSNMLNKSKGHLCNLIFHELFHATYYAKSSVDFNENLASFIAHKATIRFLQLDTNELREYMESYDDNLLIEKHLSVKIKELNNFYDSISGFSKSEKDIFRLKKLNEMMLSLNALPVHKKRRISGLQSQIMEYKNAWFVDFNQYNALQDSLEGVFNKFYRSDLRKMVQSLK